VRRLLGAAFEHITLDRRTESYLVTTVLDICAALQLGEPWPPVDGWKVAPHHEREPHRSPDRINESWDSLAISSVLHDRHFLSSIRALIAWWRAGAGEA